MLSEGDVLFLDGVESDHAVRNGLRIGAMVPANTTAAGKCILAALPPKRLRSLYPEDQLPTLTGKSIKTFAQLEKELEEIRKRGYATNDEESEDGLRAVAASVADASSVLRVMPGLTVGGPKDRMTAKRMKTLGSIVVEYAAMLRHELVLGERRTPGGAAP